MAGRRLAVSTSKTSLHKSTRHLIARRNGLIVNFSRQIRFDQLDIVDDETVVG